MALTHRFRLLFPAAVLAGLTSASASPSLSVSSDTVSQASTGSTGRRLLQNKMDSVFQASTGLTGRRSLLQAKDDCPVSFESQNYTIITSKCKAPKFPSTECCDAFKKFACPFATYLNNGSTNCAETMLTYINLHGSYPAGLFDECLKVTEWASCKGILADCPMDFEYQNYTIITSKCKAPHYPRKECCDAFKDFACPFAMYLNNESTNCAATMVSGIDFFGKYPEGLFAYECLEGKKGVYCEGVPGIDTGVSSGGQRDHGSSGSLIGLPGGLGELLFH